MPVPTAKPTPTATAVKKKPATQNTKKTETDAANQQIGGGVDPLTDNGTEAEPFDKKMILIWVALLFGIIALAMAPLFLARADEVRKNTREKKKEK